MLIALQGSRLPLVPSAPVLGGFVSTTACPPTVSKQPELIGMMWAIFSLLAFLKLDALRP